MDNNFEKVKKFISKERWNYDFELRYETSLQSDLNIYGDEATDFLLKFCKTFKIDYENFDFDKYFRPEPSWFDIFQRKKKYHQLTINDLVNALKTRSLI